MTPSEARAKYCPFHFRGSYMCDANLCMLWRRFYDDEIDFDGECVLMQLAEIKNVLGNRL